jgi:hypothetical protein
MDKSVGTLSPHCKAMAEVVAKHTTGMSSFVAHSREATVTDHACNWRSSQQTDEEVFKHRSHC